MTPAALAAALVAGDQVSAPVTSWGPRLLLTGLVLVVIGLALWGMRAGWKGRARRQADLPAPPPVPPGFVPDLAVPSPGRYLASTTAGQWLDRVVVHGLGAPAAGTIAVGGAGVLLDLEGADPLFIPAAGLEAVGSARGIAGQVFEQGGVLLLTWRLGGALLDTGWRAQRTEDHLSVAAAAGALLPASASSAAAPGAPSTTTAGSAAQEGEPR